MAIAMAKEFGGVNFEEARQIWSEAVGRRYWENCSTFSCAVFSNWRATNSFLNFLSYDQAMRDMTITDISVIFMAEQMRNSMLDVAAKITRNGLGAGGKLENRPYDYFCTNCFGIVSPKWLTHWLVRTKENRNFGMNSYSGNGEMQVAYAAGGPDVFTVVLTPKQKTDLCGQKNCFDPTLEKPAWMK